jgi:Predicted alpha/beta hydrolase
VSVTEPEKIQIDSTDGFKLSGTFYRSEHAKGVIQINSATGVKKEFYHHFATYLQSQNYHVITFDYRGIGGSRPKSLRGFVALNHEWGKKDMTAVLDWVDGQFPKLKKFIIGHSAGGQQLGMMTNHHKISKAYLMGCSIGYWPYLSSPYKYFAALAFYFIFPVSIRLFGYVPSKRLGLGEDLPKGVALEWRSWCMNPMYFGKYLDTTLQPHYYDQVALPIHSLYAEDDTIANPKTVKVLLSLYPNANSSSERLLLKDLHTKKIGHFGYFSRTMKDKLWRKPIDFFEA